MTGGRPILVIDMGGTGIKLGFSVDGKPHPFRRVLPTPALLAGDPVAALARMIAAVSGEADLSPEVIVATVPGFIDLDGDRILSAANIPSLNGRALASELGALVGCRVLLERDAVLLLTGEAAAGAGRDSVDVLGMFFGTGVGTAYLHEGQPFRGGGWALELGLMPFRGDGRSLPGLRTDCLEAYCSGRVLQEIANRHRVPIGEIFPAAAGAPALEADIAVFLRDQAFAVGCAVAMVSPRTIVIGGGIPEMAGYPRQQLAALVARHAPIAETARPMDLRWAELGWTAVLHGAPRVVAERLGADASGPDAVRRR